MCPLCSASADSKPFCSEHDKQWKEAPEYRRVEAFATAKDKRLPALRSSAVADFVYRVLRERLTDIERAKP